MARGRAIIEVSADAQGAISVLGEVSNGLDNVKASATEAGREAASFDARLNRLLNSLDPARAATERYERQLALLKEAFDKGKISQEQFARASELLKQRLDEKLSSTSKLNTAFGELLQRYTGLTPAAFGMVGAITAVGGGLIAATKAAMDAEVADRRLEAVLKATGGAAGLTARQMSEFATELQRSTGVSDESIKQAMAVMATFRTVSGDTFREAIKLSLDLSAVFGQDLQSSAIQVGKALEDPANGITALKRVGVSFTETQRAMIEHFMELGKQEEAQKIILEALRVQVGGAAETMGQAADGAVKRLKQELGDLAEVLGGILLPIVKKVAEGWQSLAALFNELAGQAKSRGIKGVVDTLGDLAVGLGLAKAESVNAGAALLGLKDSAEKAEIQVRKLERPTKQLAGENKALDEAAKKAAEQLEKQDKAAKQLAEKSIKQLEQSTQELNKAQGERFKLVYQLVEKGYDYEKLIRMSIPELEALAAKEDLAAYQADRWAKELDQQLIPAIIRARDEASKTTLEEAIAAPPKPDWLARWRNIWGQAGREAAAALAPSISGGILDVVAGSDFRDAFSGIFEALGQRVHAILSRTIGAALQTGSLEQGLLAGGWVSQSGAVNWGQIGAVGGTLLWGYGASRGNRGAGALGGAIAGASMGMAFSPIGAVIGAIIGGVLGYLTSGQKTYGYNVAIDRYGRGIVDLTGVSQAEEDERLRQLRDTASGYFAGFRSLLELLGQQQPDVSQWRFEMHGQAGDIGAIWQQILRGELPRSILQLYQPAIEAGLSGLGVAQGRIAELMGRFETGQFEQAIQELQDYVQTLIEIRDLHRSLSRSLSQLRHDLQLTIEEQLAQGTQHALEKVRADLEAMSSMTGPEQVARARELVGLIEQQGQALLAYLQQIFAAQQQAEAQAEQLRYGWEAERMRAAGRDRYAAWLIQQIEQQQEIIAGASDLATAQTAWQRVLQMLQELHGIDGYARTAEQLLDQLEKGYKEQLDRLAEAAQQQLQRLDDALSAVEAVLTSESAVHQELTEAIQDETEARREQRQLEREDYALLRRRMLDAADASAAAAAAAVSLAAAAASAAGSAASAAAALDQLGQVAAASPLTGSQRTWV